MSDIELGGQDSDNELDVDMLNDDGKLFTDTVELDAGSDMGAAGANHDVDAIISSILKHISADSVTVSLQEIPIASVKLNEAFKVGRASSHKGLTASVMGLGLLSPIQVMTLRVGGVYQLLSGVRRLFSCCRTGATSISALVYDFANKDVARQVAPVLSLLLGRSEAYTIKEIWGMSLLLKEQINMNESVLEYLFQLPDGDYLKLQACMQSRYIEDVVEPLSEGELTIDAAFKKLTKLRKSENRLEMEEVGEKGVAEVVNDVMASDKDVLKMLEFDTSAPLNEDSEPVELEDMVAVGSMSPKEKQDAYARHPVDPEIRRKTFERDNYTCRCCNHGGTAYKYLLDFHHVNPKSCGGADTVENGATFCLTCHQAVHLYAVGDLDLEGVREEDIATFKRIVHFGNIIIVAVKAKGKTVDEFKLEENAHFKGRVPYWLLSARAKEIEASDSDTVVSVGSDSVVATAVECA